MAIIILTIILKSLRTKNLKVVRIVIFNEGSIKLPQVGEIAQVGTSAGLQSCVFWD